MVRRSAHHTQGSSAQIIRPAVQEGRSRYCVIPPPATATAATNASGAAAPYERASAKVPSTPTQSSASFTAVENTSTFGATVASSPMAATSGLNSPHCPSATAFPLAHACRSTSGQCPARSCSPRRYSQPRYADWVSPWKK